jgi:hypothetical protein
MPRKKWLQPIWMVVAISCLVLGCAGTTIETRTQSFQVLTNPPGAMVWQANGSVRKNLGPSPVVVEHSYTVEKKASLRWLAWVIGGVGGASTAVGWTLYSKGAETSGYTPGQYLAYGGLAVMLGAVYLYNLFGTLNPDIPVPSEPVTLGASLDGFLDRSQILAIPSPDNLVRFDLPRDPRLADAGKGEPVPASTGAAVQAPQVEDLVSRQEKPVPSQGLTFVLAVFDIQDASNRMTASSLDQLTEYLAAKLTQSAGYRVIPRKQIQDRIAAEKKASHRRCYDEACQIELGKSLAAQKSLATKILRIGNKCALTSILYDLKTETTEKAASVDTGCSDEALMDGLKQIAQQLMVQRPR